MPKAVDGVSQQEIDRLNALVRADPDIQRVLQAEKAKLAQTRDKGGKDQEYQNGIRGLITHIAKQKGLIPEKGAYFVNPNDGNLEPHGGWSGMNGWQKALAIAGVAAATLATAGAFGAFAGGAAAAGGGASAGAGGAGAAAATGAGTAASAGTLGTLGAVAGTTAATGGGIGAGTTAAIGGGLGSTLLKYGLNYGVPLATNYLAQRSQNGAISEANAAQQSYNDRALAAAIEEQQYNRKFAEEGRDYQRGQFKDYTARLEPYYAAGEGATGAMRNFLGQGGSSPAEPSGGGAMVKLRAPTGEVSDVPASQADWYLSKGAQRA